MVLTRCIAKPSPGWNWSVTVEPGGRDEFAGAGAPCPGVVFRRRLRPALGTGPAPGVAAGRVLDPPRGGFRRGVHGTAHAPTGDSRAGLSCGERNGTGEPCGARRVRPRRSAPPARPGRGPPRQRLRRPGNALSGERGRARAGDELSADV